MIRPINSPNFVEVVQQPDAGEWKYSKFGCFEDIPTCLYALFLPPCFVLKTVVLITDDTCCGMIACCFPITLVCIRGNTREKRGIDGSFFGDLCSVCCCGCCTTIQMKREFTD